MTSEPARPFLTDAELILGLSRHLGTYAVGSSHAALSQLEFAGHVYEMAWRLRGSGLSSLRRVEAIGIEAGIPQRQLLNELLPALETLGWVDVRRDGEGSVIEVDEHVPPPAELLSAGGSVVAIAIPTPTERAALVMLRDTSCSPLSIETALEAAGADVGEGAARAALKALCDVQLVRVLPTDDGREVVFNPFIWQCDASLAQAVLRAEDAGVQGEVGALIEEVAARPGLPQDHVTATEGKWIDFAVAQGLVQRTLVETSTGETRAFLFTPHLARDPFGVSSGDPSGHVRQLVGSMIYATTFATNKLYNPHRFLSVLLAYGEAGDATVIGTDYTMLETAGIVRVEPGFRYKKMVLLQPDVAEEASTYLEGESRGDGDDDSSGVMNQRSYAHLERERAKIAAETPSTTDDHRRLISALRDTAGKRSFDA